MVHSALCIVSPMIIYHLVPKRFYEQQIKNAVYLPKPFAQEGFIHCTRRADEMARVANRFYKQERGPHVYLYIVGSVCSPISPVTVTSLVRES